MFTLDLYHFMIHIVLRIVYFIFLIFLDSGYVFKMLGILVAIAYCLNISKYLMNNLGLLSGNH